MEKVLVRVSEAAEITSVGRSKAYELIAMGTQSGGWPSIRIGRSVRVPVEGLLEWIERQKTVARDGFAE